MIFGQVSLRQVKHFSKATFFPHTLVLAGK